MELCSIWSSRVWALILSSLCMSLPCMAMSYTAVANASASYPTTLSPGFAVTRTSDSKLADVDGPILLTSPSLAFFLSLTSCRLVVAHNDTRASNTVVWSLAFPSCSDAASHTLALGYDGNLVVNSTSSTGASLEVWSSSTSFEGVHTMQLDNSGNLYLYNDEFVPLWQSFYYPSSVLLSDQYLEAGMNLILTHDDDDDALLATNINYSLAIEPHRAVLYSFDLDGQAPKPYWELRPNDPSNGSIGYAALDGTNGMLQLFESNLHGLVAYNNGTDTNDSKSFKAEDASLWRAEITSKSMGHDNVSKNSGNLEIYYWSKNDMTWHFHWQAINNQCDFPYPCMAYATCDPYTQGCTCQAPLISTANGSCEIAHGPSLQPNFCINSKPPKGIDFVELPKTSYFPLLHGDTGYSASYIECRSSCLQNCSCAAFVYQQYSNSCYPIHQPPNQPLTLSFLRANDDLSSVYVRTSSSSATYLSPLLLIFIFLHLFIFLSLY